VTDASVPGSLNEPFVAPLTTAVLSTCALLVVRYLLLARKLPHLLLQRLDLLFERLVGFGDCGERWCASGDRNGDDGGFPCQCIVWRHIGSRVECANVRG
jgi:hypothetical protein